MATVFSCKDCGDRYPGCHDKCEKYKAEKAAHDERKAQEYQKAKVRNDINNQKGVVIARTTRKNSWYSKYRNMGRR